ncbi:DNA polymerase epsilon catalytic subunit [Paramarasmius palmivorus]|uniref:DNA polymerase epsilon catalytic subunit n=1 Tax=Paramarasmius palmivorus TaxID=297713 RepID=A0AAW0BIR3_9AGAR
MLLDKCSDFTIDGDVSLTVAGNQHNYFISDDLVQLCDPTIRDQYRQLQTGNIHLKRKIVETTVKIRDAKGWKILDAYRIIHAANIHGEGDEKDFLHVQYIGPNANQAYEKGFKTFSGVKLVRQKTNEATRVPLRALENGTSAPDATQKDPAQKNEIEPIQEFISRKLMRKTFKIIGVIQERYREAHTLSPEAMEEWEFPVLPGSYLHLSNPPLEFVKFVCAVFELPKRTSA